MHSSWIDSTHFFFSDGNPGTHDPKLLPSICMLKVQRDTNVQWETYFAKPKVAVAVYVLESDLFIVEHILRDMSRVASVGGLKYHNN